MKDLLIILDAVKRAQAELSAYLQPGDRNAELTIAKLTGILQHRNLVRALDVIYPRIESPALESPSLESPSLESPIVAPHNSAEAEAMLQEALPGS
jgi:hypothetical protein